MKKKPMGFRLPEASSPESETLIERYENKLVDTNEITRMDASFGSDFVDIVNEFLEKMGEEGWKIATVHQSPVGKGHNQIWFTRKKSERP